jgi:hypothetical protein
VELVQRRAARYERFSHLRRELQGTLGAQQRLLAAATDTQQLRTVDVRLEEVRL